MFVENGNHEHSAELGAIFDIFYYKDTKNIKFPCVLVV